MRKLKVLPEVEARKIFEELGARVQFVDLETGNLKLTGFFESPLNYWTQHQYIIVSDRQVKEELEKL